MAAVLEAPAATASNNSSSPYLNNAERIFDYTIEYQDEAKLHQGIRDVAREIVGGWKGLKDDQMGITVISGGITNLLYRVRLEDGVPTPAPAVAAAEGGGRRDAIVRIYGRNTEVIIQREHENRLFAQLSARGFAPPYLGRFANGRVEGYMDARPLTPEEMGQTAPVDIAGLIARELARMHSMQGVVVPGEDDGDDGEGEGNGGDGGNSSSSRSSRRRKAVLWEKMGQWARLAEGIAFDDDPKRQAQLEAIGLEQLAAEMAWLRARLEGEAYGRTRAKEAVKALVFSHQDLLCGNILYNPDWSPPRVQFIDFEYGGYNPRGFDLGNHFCEYAGFDPDYEKSYPSRDQQLHFLRTYVRALRGRPAAEGGLGDLLVTEEEEDGDGEELFVAELYVVANRYACAAHLFWGYWAIIQARYSPIDFDFLLYASQRLAGYRAFKAKFFDNDPDEPSD